MTKHICPAPGRVILKKKVKEERVENGLIIPDSANRDVQFYEVLHRNGIDMLDDEFIIEEGTTVIIDQYAERPIYLDGELFYMIKVTDIIGVVE